MSGTTEYSNITPFAATEIANRILGPGSDGKPRTSQLFYGYARSGSIASNYKQWVADGGKKSGYKVEFDGQAFMAWLNRQASGSTGTSTRHNYDALTAEFALPTE